MSGPPSVSPPSCAVEALAMVEAAFDFLNREDLPSLPVVVQAECLRLWSRAEAKGAAAHADLVGAFMACEGPRADGQRSVGAWLARFTHCTRPAARRQVGADLRIRNHPHVQAALAEAAISESYGQWIGEAVSAFYPEDQDAVEQILVQAAVSGAVVEDLATIVTVALRKLRPGGTEREEAQRHTDRGLTVSKTLGGVGRINGDLTAEATSLAETVIEALAVKKGPEDTRTKRQRRHDAFADAMRRLVDSDLLPERGGGKPHLKLDMDLATLRSLPGSKQLEDEWIDQRTAALARRRLHGDETVCELLIDQVQGQLPPALNGQGEHSAQTFQPWLPGLPDPPSLPGLPGPARGAVLAGAGPISDGLAAAIACDSVITPTVYGAIDRDALTAMTAEWLTAVGLSGCAACVNERAGGTGGSGEATSGHSTGPAGVHHHGASCDCGHGDDDGPYGDATSGHCSDTGHCPGSRCALSAETLARLQRSMLRWAIRVLSGPGGLASYLRTGLLQTPLAGPSIVLDAGTDDKTVPAPLERLVRRRDRHCRFPGCDHPAALSQVHHIVPRSRGGPTELWNLLTLCSMHHLIAVHTWGWDIRLNPDGTTTATGPDGRLLHEHQPPGDPPLQAA